MIVVLRKDATEEQIQQLLDKIRKLGLTPHISTGTERTIIGVIGPEDILQITPLEIYPGVEKVMPVLSPYKLVSREMHPQDTVLDVGKGILVGGKRIVVMAGPCAVENFDMLIEIGKAVKKRARRFCAEGRLNRALRLIVFRELAKRG